MDISLLVMMLHILSCSEKNPDSPYYNKVHPQEWYNTQFKNTGKFHGARAEDEGSESCMTCHDLNSEGQNVSGCAKCHFGGGGDKAPDGSDWGHGLEGHEEFQDSRIVCNYCHDYERYFGTGPGACHDCHGSGDTHVLGQPWLDRNSPQFHGNLSQDECSICHNMSIKCSQCHFGETGSRHPPGSGWIHGDNEEHEDYERYAGTCNQCHNLNRLYGNGPDNCHDCHDD